MFLKAKIHLIGTTPLKKQKMVVAVVIFKSFKRK